MAIQSFGSRMREERKRQGLTLKQLGLKMGISGSLVGRYERDEENPKPDTIRKFAEALNVSPSWLVYGEGSPKQKALYDAWEQLDVLFANTNGIVSGKELLPIAKEIERCVDGAVEEMEQQVSQTTRQRDLLRLFLSLNEVGQYVALERLEELAQLPKYQRHPSPNAPQETPSASPHKDPEQE